MNTQTAREMITRDKLLSTKRCAILLSSLALLFGVACEEADETDASEQQLAEDRTSLWYHSCGRCGSSDHCSHDEDVARVVRRVVVMAKHSKKMMTAKRDDSVTQQRFFWSHCRRKAQRWTFKELDSGEYEILNRRRDKCLGIVDESPVPEELAVMQECSRSDGQLWQLQESDDGYFEIVNVNSDMCLSVEGESLESGAALIQFPCDGSAAQQWKLFGFRL
jgi:hypothetical protein